MPEPAVRARHLKSTLAAADRTPARAAIRDAMAAPVIDCIAASSGFDWLPVEYDVALVRAIHGALGDAGHDAFSRAVILEAFDGLLLGPIVRLALAVKGRDPDAWIRWVPKAWPLVFRNCGSWTLGAAVPGEARLTLEGLPPVCFDDPVWTHSVASSVSALLARVGVVGSTRLEARDPAQRGDLPLPLVRRAGRLSTPLHETRRRSARAFASIGSSASARCHAARSSSSRSRAFARAPVRSSASASW